MQIYYLHTCIILNVYSKSKEYTAKCESVQSNLPAPAKWLELVMPARLHIGEPKKVKGHQDVLEVRSDGPPNPLKMVPFG